MKEIFRVSRNVLACIYIYIEKFLYIREIQHENMFTMNNKTKMSTFVDARWICSEYQKGEKIGK